MVSTARSSVGLTVGAGRAGRFEPLVPAIVAGGLATMAIMLRWRGSDLPAHFFRVGLVERYGFEVWNNYWFAGHHTLGYGAMFPVLGAAIGIWTVAVVSAVLSAALADLVIATAIGHRSWSASLWFAFGTLTNVAVGRLPFALGVTIGLGSLLAAQHRRVVVCLVLAAATASASPVVSVFLVIIFGAWAVTSVGRDRRLVAAAAGVTIVPVLVISALYPQGGMFPFRWTALLFTLLVCATVTALVPAGERLIRVAAGLYTIACVAAFIVPTPLGANITRLGCMPQHQPCWRLRHRVESCWVQPSLCSPGGSGRRRSTRSCAQVEIRRQARRTTGRCWPFSIPPTRSRRVSRLCRPSDIGKRRSSRSTRRSLEVGNDSSTSASIPSSTSPD